MRFRRSLAAAVAAPLFAVALPHAAQAAPTIAVPGVKGLIRVGDVDAHMKVHLAFRLRLREQPALEQLIRQQADRSSPQFRRFLSNAEWNARFAPTPETVVAVAAELQRTGFTIEKIATNNGIVDAVAPAAVVATMFRTRLELVYQPGAGLRFRNVTPAHLPAGLATMVESVAGLSDLRFTPPGPRVVPAPYLRTALVPENGPDGGYGPPVLEAGLDYPTLHGFNGRGRTAGIVIAGEFLDSDLATYLNYFKIKYTGKITRVMVDGGGQAAGGPPDETETTLDVQTLAGLAPGANIAVYEFPEFVEKNVNDTLNRVVADNRVDSFSGSWGICELSAVNAGAWQPLQLHSYFLEAVAKGITPIFSTGDSGNIATGCPPDFSTVSSPADDPTVVAVGGTTFTEFEHGKLVDQSAWNGSGGGISLIFGQGSYQANFPGVEFQGRNLPDLALPGAVEDSFYDAGILNGWATVGGTSWSAPAFNALLVEAAQIGGRRFGFANPAIYAAAEKTTLHAFSDITQGNNTQVSSLPGFAAGPGYDLVTGLGAPDGYALATALK
jgi:subtilase family serine protease